MQPDAQHVGPVFPADFFRGGLGYQGREDAVIDRFGGAPHRFPAGLQLQQLPHTQPAEVQGRDPGGVSFEVGVGLLDDGRICDVSRHR
ncbi:hypothetical protein ACNO8X_17370 [Mycobacterium sp. PDNC021]|uniref:hypothetical protein n=1 Tax=Mycobacterium sp. PDNC021 TaxID=3391399 RepID=UPI003AACE021